MNEQLAYTLLASSIGFVAAIFFCIGTALLKHKTLFVLASTYWDYNEVQAIAIVSQSVQYAVGGLLLIISFLLQVAAALASPANQLLIHPVFANSYIFLLTSLLLVGTSSYLLYKLLLRWRLPPLLKELEESTK